MLAAALGGGSDGGGGEGGGSTGGEALLRFLDEFGRRHAWEEVGGSIIQASVIGVSGSGGAKLTERVTFEQEASTCFAFVDVLRNARHRLVAAASGRGGVGGTSYGSAGSAEAGSACGAMLVVEGASPAPSLLVHLFAPGPLEKRRSATTTAASGAPRKKLGTRADGGGADSAHSPVTAGASTTAAATARGGAPPLGPSAAGLGSAAAEAKVSSEK